MPRYKLTVEYHGASFAGWQRQPDRPTVEEALTNAFMQFCGEHCEVVGAGRTDAGVHATAQVAHVDLPREYDTFRIMQGVNFHLLAPYVFEGETEGICPVAITHVEEVAADFHARFSATRRRYEYRIINRRARLAVDAGRALHVPVEIDIAMMQRAANVLIGTHDFSSFRDTQCQAKSPIKTLEHLEIKKRSDEVIIETFARSFLHHQVRIMTGTLIKIATGSFPEHFMNEALKAKNRAAAGPTAPPDGLYLVGVEY